MAGAKKIFIAEDDQHFCELYQMALGTEGYEVNCAYNGRDALAMIPQNCPDLIILDVMMPEVDGYEVCRTLRELPQFALTPIIMLTALATDDEKIKGYNVGADDYLTKPFPLKVLKAKVKSLVERRAANRAAEPVTLSAQQMVQGNPSQQTTFNPTPSFEQATPTFNPTPPPASTFQPPPPLEEPPKPEPQQPSPQVQQPNVFSEPPVQPSQPSAPPPDAPQPTVVREDIKEQVSTPQEELVVLGRGAPLTSATPDGDTIAVPFLGAVPQGSNILVTGKLGCGKSRFARQ
ncbi:MAG: response regulator, partial [Deltaproteobacteria bacterium]|nr:response regulator [Deltaproteobacteria bacterium]